MKMRPKETLYNNIIRLRKNQELPGIYDVEMENIDQLKGYSSLECHISLYPYSRKISSENIGFYPFEEYVKDILSHQRSAYTKISIFFDKIFGFFMAVIIMLICIMFKPTDPFSVETVVSVFGAYIIGKELWDDIEKILVNISKGWRIRYRDAYYLYQLEKHTTLTYYSHLAKECRYGKTTLLPEKIDFIEESNSQTIRMYFNLKDFRSFKGSSAHILSIHIDASLLDDFEDSKFIFGVKLSFNKTFCRFVRCFELFQSINIDSKGCLDEKGEWVEGALFYRNTLTFGKLKWFINSGLLHERSIIST